MGSWRTAIAGCAALSCCAVSAAAPPAEDVRDASVAMGFGTKARCPDLMSADAQDSAAALVLFLVGPTGVPSQASIKASSGSPSLDTEAVDCVLRLRFHPAVRAGDGAAVSSWQEIAWKWGRAHTAAANAAPAAPSVAPAHSGAASAEVRVCVDAAGRLAQEPAVTRSSGDPVLDAAALRAARSASGSFPAPGCMHLALTPEDSSKDGGR